MSLPASENSVKRAPVISVISVTWNAKKYVHECLRSLAEDDDPETEVIIVDNASSDGTPDVVAREFSSFRLLRNSENLGFAKANNAGIRISCGDYVCLINSDVVVPRGCLRRLAAYMQANPTVGLVGPRMIGPDGVLRRSTMRLPSFTNSIGRALGADRIPMLSRVFGGQMMSDFSHEKTADVEVLNGWFWMVRREALDQVGLLDEQFFIYGEDLDWCNRFRKLGWRIVFFADAKAIHYGGASSSAAPVRFYLEMQRANLQYWRKHHGAVGLALNCAIVTLQHAVRLICYSALSFLKIGNMAEAAAKRRRSRALLAWMAGADNQNTEASANTATRA
jgi:GT2 family glycosyltransferase